jgi:hypothetical protein
MPSRITYDASQDGRPDWVLLCDLGAPKEAVIDADVGGREPGGLARRITLTWGDFPQVAEARLGRGLDFTFGRDALAWTPVYLYLSPVLFDCPGEYRFFIPELPVYTEMPTLRLFIARASQVVIDLERSPRGEPRVARFTLQSGQALHGDYYRSQRLYATGDFTGGILTRRSVDVEGKGLFEQTEEYRFDPSNTNTPPPDPHLYGELFGALPYPPGLALSRITLDYDGDTKPDYEVAYRTDGSTVSRWYEREGEERFTRLPPGGPDAPGERHETTFTYGPDYRTVTIRFEEGTPVALVRDGVSQSVTKAEGLNFYWIGSGYDPLEAPALHRFLEDTGRNGVYIYEDNGRRHLLVRSGHYRFGEGID